MIDPTFWLFVSFVIFALFAYWKLKTPVSKAFSDYRVKIILALIAAEDEVKKSTIELEETRKKTNEIKSFAEKIYNSGLLEVQKIGAETGAIVSQYLTFKEKKTFERIQILVSVKTGEAKKIVIEKAIKVITSYFEEKKEAKFNPLAEIKQIKNLHAQHNRS